MHVAKSILFPHGGAITGIVFVISCGDNLHLNADATIDAPKVIDAALTCNCPATEPPLAGRFVVVSGPQIIFAKNIGYQGVACPTGTTLISGSCMTDGVTPVRNVTLQQTGVHDVPPSAWNCAFYNNEPTPVTIRASVICLKPAP